MAPASEEGKKTCPLCQGRLESGISNIPFLFSDTVIVVKGIPAQVCENCHEPYISGKATDRLTDSLARLRSLRAEVLVISYEDIESAPAASAPPSG